MSSFQRLLLNIYIYIPKEAGILAPLRVGISSADSNIRRLSEVSLEYLDTIRLPIFNFRLLGVIYFAIDRWVCTIMPLIDIYPPSGLCDQHDLRNPKRSSPARLAQLVTVLIQNYTSWARMGKKRKNRPAGGGNYSGSTGTREVGKTQ
jgi:hypothetical protein